MKQRKFLLTLFLILAVSLIGLGYAALSKELKISGNVKGAKNNDNLVVHFVADAISTEILDTTEDAVNVTVTPTITSDLVANIVVDGMNGIGDKAVVYLLIQNDSDARTSLNATLRNPVVTVTTTGTGADTGDTNNASNIFEGVHYKITVTYETENNQNVAATGDVLEGNQASIAAKTTDDGIGENIWVRVEIELIDAITLDLFPQHNIQVLFDAVTQ